MDPKMDMTTTVRRRAAARRGFSLLEITLVLLIIGMLAGAAAIALPGRIRNARIRTTWADMQLYKTQLNVYMAEKQGTLPPALTGLVTAGYVEDQPFVDAWGSEFHYVPRPADPVQKFELISFGPDRTAGTEDDINIWTYNPDA